MNLNLPAALAKGRAAVLAALVAVVDGAPRFALLQRHVQGREHDLSSQAFAHGLAHHTSAPDIDSHGQIEQPHPGWHVGHVHHLRVKPCIILMIKSLKRSDSPSRQTNLFPSNTCVTIKQEISAGVCNTPAALVLQPPR